MHNSCRPRPLETTAACTVLGGRQCLLQCCWIVIFFRLGLKTTKTNKAANAALCDAVHRLHQGILYFQHVIRFNSALINVISYTLVSKILEWIFTEPQKFAKQLCEYFLQRISPRSHSMGREHKYKLIYAPVLQALCQLSWAAHCSLFVDISCNERYPSVTKTYQTC